MTIETTAPIYNFRQFSPLAGKRLTSRSAPEQNSIKPQQLDLFDAQPMPARRTNCGSESRAQANPDSNQTGSVSELIDQYFADKIHRDDEDQDGQLNRKEFSGNKEQFDELDEDQDGHVRASDMRKQFLNANPEMRKMVEGFASKLYDRVLNAASSNAEELSGVVEDFFTGYVNEHDVDNDNSLDRDEFPGTNKEFRQIAGLSKQVISKEDLVKSFVNNNPDLAELRESLLRLKGIVDKQQARSRSVDVYT